MFKSHGWKTYTIGIGMIVMGCIQFVLYIMSPEENNAGFPTEAIDRIMEGFGLIFVRSAVKVIEPRSSMRTSKDKAAWDAKTEKETIRGDK